MENQHPIRQLIVSLARRHPDRLVIVHGNARGVDRIARDISEELEIPFWSYPARWSRYGRAAGPIRNRAMLDDAMPSAVYGFFTDLDESVGTKDMITEARRRRIPTHSYLCGHGWLSPEELGRG